MLFRSPGKLRPCRGLVLDWRRERRHWEALVVYFDEQRYGPGARMNWLTLGDLTPIDVTRTRAEASGPTAQSAAARNGDA